MAERLASDERREVECPMCRGFGIVAFEHEEDQKEPWRWIVCRPCFGRGTDPSWDDPMSWIMPTPVHWHRATDIYELVHFSVQIQLKAPAHPADILIDEQDQVRYIRQRREKLKAARWKILRERVYQKHRALQDQSIMGTNTGGHEAG